VYTAASQRIEEIPHIQALSNVFFVIEFAPGIQGHASLTDQFSG
jgi:hypothetical protein